jgi:hypothetical protein
VCAMALSGVGAMWIHPENASEPAVFMSSPRVRFLSPHPKYPISGELVRSTDMKPSGNWTGKVLVYELHSLQFAEDLAKTMLDTGVEAIIIINTVAVVPGFTQYLAKGTRPVDTPFSLFEISYLQDDVLDDWFKNQTNGRVFVTIEEDPNPWDECFLRWLPALGYAVLITCGIILIIALYKYILLVMRDGFRANLAQLILVFSITALVIRAAWTCPDPMGAFNIFPYWWVQFAYTLPFAFVICGELMITLYWHELIQKTGRRMNPFLDGMLVPFLIVGGTVFGFELATCLARAIGAVVRWLIIIDGIVYAIVILALLIFFVITKIRLAKVFAKLNKRLNTKEKRLGIASNIVIFNGVALLIFLICLGIIGIGSLYWVPIGFFVVTSALLLSMNLICFLLVIMIRAPQRPWKWIFFGICHRHPLDLIESGDSKSLSLNKRSGSTGGSAISTGSTESSAPS